MIEQLQDAIGRQRTAAQARPQTFVHRRVGESAAASSRKLLLQAQADLMNSALRTFITLCYDSVGGPGGLLCNIDGSGAILVPSPWSRARHAAYGLSDGQHRTLRKIVVARASGQPSRNLVFWYSAEFRRWFLNTRHYPTLADALRWLDSGPIRADEILTHGGL